MTDASSAARRAGRVEKNFLHDLAFDLPMSNGTDNPHVAGTFEVTAELLMPDAADAGGPRVWTGLLATIADIAMGTVFSHSAEVSTIALTVDLVTRALAPIGPGTYHVDATVLKRGRTLCIGETRFRSDETTIAHSVATFMPLSFDGPLDMPQPHGGQSIGAGTLDEPFVEALDIVVERPGEATVGRRAYALQPSGTIQGGVVSTLAEVAAQSLVGGAVVDLDVRFLGQVRTGPARAVAERLDDSTVRVVVTDDGRGDGRPTAFAVARLQPPG